MAEKNKNNNSLVFADNGYQSYIDFSKLSFADKLKRRLNIAKAQFDNGSLAKAGYALVGGYDPENPRLSTGDVPNPGMRNPKQVVQTVQKAKSIAERAAKISNKIFDRQYQRAINSGNPKRVQAVRNLHFSAKAPETKVVDIKGRPQLVIHKTPNNFTVFDNSRSIGKLNWAATQKAFEGENGVFATGAGTNPKEMHLYVNMKNPHYPTIEEGMEPSFINEGEDGILGIVDKDITDFYKSASDAGEGFHMSLGVDNPYALKFYNSITYDNNGNIIPISQRDNFLINDIRYKQGGKMNILEFLKNGSGIHIKEKNKGKFTRWCGGNVTKECIQRGKNSSNPKIRKKATFADNARHFKHKKGGKAFVKGVNILDSNPDAYKHVKKKYKMHQEGGSIITNWSPIVAQSQYWQYDNSDYIRQKEEQKLQQKIREDQLKAQKMNTITNGITSIGGQLLQNLPIFKSSVKTIAPSATTISNIAKNTFWNNPTITNAQVTRDFWSNPTIANSISKNTLL